MLQFVKSLLRLAVLLVLMPLLCQAKQAITSNPSPSQVVVQVLDGRNGKPIKKNSGDSIRDAVQKNYRTNGDGKVVVRISGTEKEVAVWLPDFFIDCYGDEANAGQVERFSVSKVLSIGVVSANNCGPDHRDHPTPRVLIVYMRKMTRKERRLI